MSDAPFELSVERHIAAPPAALWTIMTDRITEWWCPKAVDHDDNFHRRVFGRLGAAKAVHGRQFRHRA